MEFSTDVNGCWRKFEMVGCYYENVPLNGDMSDLTVNFFVRKVDKKTITLAFIDLHVM